MSIDVFGRHLGSSKVAKGPPGIGFNLTKTGNFDLEQKKLCNVADAVDDSDAVNLNILRPHLQKSQKGGATASANAAQCAETIFCLC